MAASFAEEMAGLAAAIRQREAENRATDKAFAAKRSPCAQRASDRQQRFLNWCSTDLQTAVLQAAVALQPAGWKLTLTTQRPPNCRYMDESRNWILGQTEIALVRDGAKRVLAITLRMDGGVCATDGGRTDGPYLSCPAEKLDAAYAPDLLQQYIRRAISA
jgi:hypothetical protein